MSLLALFGWSFLPDLVTGWTQSLYYALTIRAGERHPQPGTPRYAEHRRRIHMLVVSAYLAYTVYEADYELRRAGSFYADLGVPLDATERDIKTRFRRLAALHHPDKVQVQATAGSTPLDAGATTAYFVHLKTAADTLLDPARRFAYDRFGRDAVAWAAAGPAAARCVTVADFVVRGVRTLLPYYGAAAAGVYLLGLLGSFGGGGGSSSVARWLVLASVLVFELHAVTRPHHPRVLTAVVNPVLARVAPVHGPLLPFQAVALARQLSITLFIALSRLVPLLGADTRSGQIVAADAGDPADVGAAVDPQLQAALDRLDAASRALDADATRMFEMEMAPFAGQDDVLQSMRAKIQQWLVQNTIRSDPMVRDAVGRSLQRRRADVPAGARGTR